MDPWYSCLLSSSFPVMNVPLFENCGNAITLVCIGFPNTSQGDTSFYHAVQIIPVLMGTFIMTSWTVLWQDAFNLGPLATVPEIVELLQVRIGSFVPHKKCQVKCIYLIHFRGHQICMHQILLIEITYFICINKRDWLWLLQKGSWNFWSYIS